MITTFFFALNQELFVGESFVVKVMSEELKCFDPVENENRKAESQEVLGGERGGPGGGEAARDIVLTRSASCC